MFYNKYITLFVQALLSTTYRQSLVKNVKVREKSGHFNRFLGEKYAKYLFERGLTKQILKTRCMYSTLPVATL